jgi:hypothetical protein
MRFLEVTRAVLAQTVLLTVKQPPRLKLLVLGLNEDSTNPGSVPRGADEATMLKVMASPTKLVSRRAASAVEKL